MSLHDMTWREIWALWRQAAHVPWWRRFALSATEQLADGSQQLTIRYLRWHPLFLWAFVRARKWPVARCRTFVLGAGAPIRPIRIS